MKYRPSCVIFETLLIVRHATENHESLISGPLQPNVFPLHSVFVSKRVTIIDRKLFSDTEDFVKLQGGVPGTTAKLGTRACASDAGDSKETKRDQRILMETQ